MKAALPAIAVLVQLPIFAGMVTTQAASGRPLVSGSAYCADSRTGPVSCAIDPIFSDPTGRNDAVAMIQATADFGTISGDVAIFSTNTSISASYQSSAGDDVRVLGGSGIGTLITHYRLVSSDQQITAPGRQVPPFYRFLQGNSVVEHTPDLPERDSTLVSTLTEDLDVTSPVVFGTPIPLAAGTRAGFDDPHGGGRFFGLETTSSAQIAGYTVLDANGNVLPGAVVQRTFSADPDPFVPEPATVWMGIWSVVLLRARVRTGTSRRVGGSPAIEPAAGLRRRRAPRSR